MFKSLRLWWHTRRLAGDSKTRRAAIKALGRLGDPRATVRLADYLDVCVEKDSSVRCAAAEALAMLGDAHGVKALIDELQASRRWPRQAAATALGRLAVSCPEMILDCWPRVANLARHRHWDHHLDAAGHRDWVPPSDCHQHIDKSHCDTGHTDEGIGVAFPDPPLVPKEGHVSVREQRAEQPFLVRCAACGKSLKAPSRLAGRTSRCPTCGTTIQIPARPDGGADAEPDF